MLLFYACSTKQVMGEVGYLIRRFAVVSKWSSCYSKLFIEAAAPLVVALEIVNIFIPHCRQSLSFLLILTIKWLINDGLVFPLH